MLFASMIDCDSVSRFVYLRILKRIVLIICFGALLLPLQLSAQPPGAVVSRLDGAKAWYKRSGSEKTWLPIQKGTFLPIGSSVKTDGISHVVMIYKSLQFRIGPGSQIEIRNLVNKGKNQLYLNKGAAWFHLKKGDGMGLSVSSPTTIAAVRGTKFALLEYQNSAKTCVCEGQVDVKGKHGGGRLIGQGQSLQLDAAGVAKLVDYSKLFKGANVDPAFLKLKEAPQMQYCLSCHKVNKDTKTTPDTGGFEDY